MNDAELDAIEARATLATPGPWGHEQIVSHCDCDICLDYQVPGAGYPVLLATTFGDSDRPPITTSDAQANAAFIAHAREDVPRLVAEVRLLRGLLADAALDSRLMSRVVKLRKAFEEVLSTLRIEDYNDGNKVMKCGNIARRALAADAEE